MKKSIILPMIGAFCVLSNLSAMEIKPYVGVDLTKTHLGYDSSKDFSNADANSYGINIGVKLHENFAVEVSYQNSEEKVVASNQQWYVDKYTINSLSLDLIGILPINENFDILGSIGVASYKTKDIALNYDGGIGTNHMKAITVGAGIQYNFADNWSIRGTVKYLGIDESWIDYGMQSSIGLKYTF
ncbi:MAG: porin family protein [Rickettsiales bacterium]|nr:porin family protein [Rickettsiales bacterium]